MQLGDWSLSVYCWCLFHFLQLFDSFTTGHDVSGKTQMQLLQCGGSGDIDFQEARVYLDTISNRCVSYWGPVLVKLEIWHQYLLLIHQMHVWMTPHRCMLIETLKGWWSFGDLFAPVVGSRHDMDVYDESLTRWLCESIPGFTRSYNLILFLSLSMQRCCFNRHELILVGRWLYYCCTLVCW